MGTGDLLGLKNFFKNKDYQYFCLVKDPASGEMVHWGDSAFAFDFLKQQKGVERRLSRDWIPVKDIKMTQPFCMFVDNTKEVRSFSSQMMHHFMTKKQKLGQVGKLPLRYKTILIMNASHRREKW